MAKVRDRTEDFKDTARRAALNLGYEELESIRALEQFLLKHKKDYVDGHRITEQERNSIEHEVLILSEKLHSVTSQFDQLGDAINRVKTQAECPYCCCRELSYNSEIRQTDDVQAEAIRFQQQQLDDETRVLQVINWCLAEVSVFMA